MCIAAIVPIEGQGANDVLKPYPPTPGLGHMAPDASGYLSLTRQGVEEDFVPDLPARERALVFATQGPWNSTALAATVPNPAWRSRPSWFIAVDDRMLPADLRAGYRQPHQRDDDEAASGDVPMLSRPKQVVVIVDAARENEQPLIGLVRAFGFRLRCACSWPRSRSAAVMLQHANIGNSILSSAIGWSVTPQVPRSGPLPSRRVRWLCLDRKVARHREFRRDRHE